jgi:hypothetical protein
VCGVTVRISTCSLSNVVNWGCVECHFVVSGRTRSWRLPSDRNMVRNLETWPKVAKQRLSPSAADELFCSCFIGVNCSPLRTFTPGIVRSDFPRRCRHGGQVHVTSELRVSFRAIYVFVAGVKAYIYSGVPWYYESRSSCGTITVYVSSSLTYRGDAVTHCFQASIKNCM